MERVERQRDFDEWQGRLLVWVIVIPDAVWARVDVEMWVLCGHCSGMFYFDLLRLGLFVCWLRWSCTSVARSP
jgi:hypothetical protein